MKSSKKCEGEGGSLVFKIGECISYMEVKVVKSTAKGHNKLLNETKLGNCRSDCRQRQNNLQF